jgi:signal transduction histidine kinase
VRGRSPSILHRIVGLHVVALGGVTIAITVAAYFLLNSTVNDFENRLLRDHAASVASYLAFGGGGWSLALPPDLQAIYTKGYGGYALAVVSDEGHVIYSSLPNDRPFSMPEPHSSQTTYFNENRGASVYYGTILPVNRQGHAAWIQVGQNLENPDVIIDDVVALFVGRIAWLVVPIFVVLLLMDVLLMRRLLKPIVAASHVASSIGPEQPLLRLPTGALPREVLPLAEAVNEALDRLEKSLQAQREFTADAAHELRTPLAILRTHVDTILDVPAAAALQSDIDAMGHVLDQLLELAELEGFAIGQSERVNLTELGAEVVGLMAPIALAEHKSLEFSAGPAPVLVFGNAEMLFRALRNLVENATRHSRPNQSVEVEVALPAIIRVMDRGPGIKPAERQLIFQRFWRRNRQDKGHSGLGLAIVAKIIQLHHGTIEVTDRDGGGATFSILLPALHVSSGSE